jgi:hypothetical protein
MIRVILQPKEAKAALQTDTLEAVADRGYFNGEEIVRAIRPGQPACQEDHRPHYNRGREVSHWISSFRRSGGPLYYP